jgi:hypothetical protein
MLSDEPQFTKSEPSEKSCPQNRKNTRSHNQNRGWLKHLGIKRAVKQSGNNGRTQKSGRSLRSAASGFPALCALIQRIGCRHSSVTAAAKY